MVGNWAARFFPLVIVSWVMTTQSGICQSPPRVDQRQADQTCYPVDQIIVGLGKNVDHNKNTYSESTLIASIKQRTVCSRPTASELGKIRSAGGSEKLIDAVEAASPAPLLSAPAPPCPQPEVVAPKQGRLTVTCSLVDCNVFVNGTSIGTTTNRALSQAIPEGPAAVSVTAQNYEPDRQQEIVEIKNSEPKLINFKLTASRAALEEMGAKLFTQMIEALGGEDGLKASALVRGKGAFTSYRDGKPTQWQIVALMKLPDKARFIVGDFKGGRQSYEIVRTEGEMELIKTAKGVALDDLILALHQLQDYQLTDTLKRLRSPSFRITATELLPGRGQDVALAAQGGSERYLISLDTDRRPREIVLVSGGLDKGLRVLYSDYAHAGPAFYPKRMQVLRPDSTSNGIEVKFDTVELNPHDVGDADFVIKKGKR
jgi:hypothetical protein